MEITREVDEKFGLYSRATCQLADTYEMVDDPSTDSIISWSENGKSFIVWKPEEFSRDYITKFLKRKNISDFVAMLTCYGFRKVESENRLEFADDDFVKGEPKRLRNIIIRPDSDDELIALRKASRRILLRKTIMKKKKRMNKKIADQLQRPRINSCTSQGFMAKLVEVDLTDRVVKCIATGSCNEHIGCLDFALVKVHLPVRRFRKLQFIQKFGKFCFSLLYSLMIAGFKGLVFEKHPAYNQKDA